MSQLPPEANDNMLQYAWSDWLVWYGRVCSKTETKPAEKSHKKRDHSPSSSSTANSEDSSDSEAEK